ncbi:MAG: hypothetical protein AAFP84_08405 [Actinomycetota bacterium]
MAADDRALRPFWMHQIVEYIIGITMISVAIQSPTPAVPAVLGGIVLLNPAFSHGPAGAFRVVRRGLHRWIDVAVIALVVVGAVQPVLSIDSGTRLLMALLALVLGFVWWHTDFATRPERKQRRAAMARPSSEEIGRSAGRTVAKGIKGARKLKDRYASDE